MSNRKIIFIVGQTASGKSGLAMRVARQYGGEIIAADSRTVYKGLDIGTAKPSPVDMATIPHHLVDVADYGAGFTVADFQDQANLAIEDIQIRGHLPVIVGGSGLYMNSLIYNYDLNAEASTDQRLELEGKSIEELQQMVIDHGYNMPENSQNKRYLVRVLERGNAPVNTQVREDALIIGLQIPQDILEVRVRNRLKQMMDEGLLGEVEEAYRNYPESSEAMKGNIYRVLRPYFDGTTSLEECLEAFVRSDMKLAKRQMTWFKRNSAINWFDSPDSAMAFIKATL